MDQTLVQQLDLNDEAATVALAAAIAAVVRTGDVIGLTGDLGSGKTVFARAFIQSLGGAEEVPSPTFTLVQFYDLPDFTLYHFDLYRIENAEEVIELGMEDAFAEGVSLIEWPDRMGAYLPWERLDITLRQGAAEDSRMAELRGLGSWQGRLGELELDG